MRDKHGDDRRRSYFPRYGRWYYIGCKAVGGGGGVDRKKLYSAEKRLLAAKRNLLGVEMNFPPGSPEVRDARDLYEREKKKWDKTRRQVLQPSFTEATYFLGMDVYPQEAVRFSAVVSVCFFTALLMGFYALVSLFPAHYDFYRSYLLPVVLFGPAIVFLLLSSYPEILAKRVQALSIGRTPEPINYMTMSLRTSPSLERAVEFAAENSEEPLASHFRRVLREVALRRHQTVDEALSVFAQRWGAWSEEFKRALYTIKSAVSEASPEMRERALEKAHMIVINGSKEKVEEFASSLSGPTTVLFALGVVLPMLMGAVIPLQGMDISVTAGGAGASNSVTGVDELEDVSGSVGESVEKGSGDFGLAVVALMDVVFPFSTFAYAYYILGKRPGTSAPPQVEKVGWSREKKKGVLAGAVAGFFPVLMLTLRDVGMDVPVFSALPGVVVFLLSVSYGLGVFFVVSTEKSERERKRLLKMEKELPDALFHIGSRLLEGDPLETAVHKSGRALGDTPLGNLMVDISNRLRISRKPLDHILFGRGGLMENMDSRGVRAAMKTLVECVKKDPVSAGETIISVSSYLREMQKVDHDIKTKLKSVVDMMKSTSIIFAPLVMGVTVSLYSLLTREFSTLGARPSLSTDAFMGVLAVFLFFSVVTTSYFTTGILGGDDRVAFKRSLGHSLPAAMTLFVFAAASGMNILA